MTFRIIISTTLLLHFSVCTAQLQPMDDEDLEQVSGQVGIVLDGIKIVGDTDANLQLSFDTDITADGGTIDNVSVVGSGNGASCDSFNAGALPSLGSCNGISIGTSSDPITLDVLTDQGSTFIELKLPGDATGPSEAGSGGNFSFDYSGWGTGIDVNFRLVAFGQGFDQDNSGTLSTAESNSIFADPVWIQAKNIRAPGTELRVFADATNGVSFAGNVNLSIDELSIDYANSRSFDTVNNSFEAFAPNSTGDGPRSGSGFGSGSNTSDGSVQGVIKLGDIKVANLSLGVFPGSGLSFGSIDNPGNDPLTGKRNQPGFYLEMPAWTAAQACGTCAVGSTDGYYGSVPKTDISIGRFELGSLGSEAAGDPLSLLQQPFNVGSAEITGIRIQQLRIALGGT